jgi:hypothetical protein
VLVRFDQAGLVRRLCEADLVTFPVQAVDAIQVNLPSATMAAIISTNDLVHARPIVRILLATDVEKSEKSLMPVTICAHRRSC